MSHVIGWFDMYYARVHVCVCVRACVRVCVWSEMWNAVFNIINVALVGKNTLFFISVAFRGLWNGEKLNSTSSAMLCIRFDVQPVIDGLGLLYSTKLFSICEISWCRSLLSGLQLFYLKSLGLFIKPVPNADPCQNVWTHTNQTKLVRRH